MTRAPLTHSQAIHAAAYVVQERLSIRSAAVACDIAAGSYVRGETQVAPGDPDTFGPVLVAAQDALTHLRAEYPAGDEPTTSVCPWCGLSNPPPAHLIPCHERAS